MAEVYAGVEDVREAWERPIPESREAYVLGRIGAAHRKLRSKAPGLDARVTSGQLDGDLVRDVIVEMVLRVLRNPSGFRSETDADYSYTRDAAVASGRLMVTDEELQELGYGGSTTYSTSSADTVLACAWRPDPFPARSRGRFG